MPNKMRIIGIDPGYDRLGIAILDKPSSGKETVVHSDCFVTSKEDGITDRFLEIGEKIKSVLEEYEPDVMAVETLFLSNNQKTAMRVAETRGIILYECARKGIPIFEYNPMQIKTAVTGDGSSDKSRIIKMIGILVKMPQKKTHDDEYDAVAVALTHSASTASSKKL